MRARGLSLLLVACFGCATGGSLAREGELHGACLHLAHRGWLGRHFDHSEVETFELAAQGMRVHVRAVPASELTARTGATPVPDYGQKAALVELRFDPAQGRAAQLASDLRLTSPDGGALQGDAALVVAPPRPPQWVDDRVVEPSAAVQALQTVGIFTLITPFMSLVSGQNVMTSSPKHETIEHPTAEELAAWKADPRVAGAERLTRLMVDSDQGCFKPGAGDCMEDLPLAGQEGIAAVPAQLCMTVDVNFDGTARCTLAARTCFDLPPGLTLAARLDALGAVPLDAPARIDEVLAY